MPSGTYELKLQRRQVLGRLIVSGVSVLAISACGGGGGGDSTSEKEEALKAAYYKLEDRMVWTDVETLVGFPANHTRYDTDLVWVAGEVRLSVGFTSTGTKLIVAASLKVGVESGGWAKFHRMSYMSFFKMFIAVVVSLLASASHAQWAVYDDELKRQLILVNRIKNIEGLVSGKTYDHFESERTEAGDIKMGGGSDAAVLKGVDTKFENLTDLTDEEKAKYVGTVADCGAKETSAKHWEACMGLRNLRLQTIKQSQAMLKNLAKRREQIVSLIKKTRDFPQDDEQASLGQIQRAQFEIQGQQALMQADALQIQVLMDGYRQREAVYMTQQAEARKAALSQPEQTKTARPPRFLPVIKAGPANQ